MRAEVFEHDPQQVTLGCAQGWAGHTPVECPRGKGDARRDLDLFVDGLDGECAYGAPVLLGDDADVPISQHFGDVKAVNIGANIADGAHICDAAFGGVGAVIGLRLCRGGGETRQCGATCEDCAAGKKVASAGGFAEEFGHGVGFRCDVGWCFVLLLITIRK